ncbi:PAS-domain containing protein [Rubrivivax rivuli]|uniref:PAS-domain containing protein n=1 Tax=Rubrivivax rivuli TaxID=1862385 RepID=UPI0013E3DC91|nr:PAS-domain containing protein [Rubrivivax rivuli]
MSPSSRLKFQRLLWATAALLFADVVVVSLLAAGAVPSAPAQGLLRGAVLLNAGVALVMLLLLLLQWQRGQAEAEAARAEQVRQREVLDALQAAVVLWDADDRLVLANGDFLKVYGAVAQHIRPGVRFEDALRTAVAANLLPEASAGPEAWIQQRLAQRRQPQQQGPILRALPDGQWRRIVEQRLSDGSLLAHSVDVTELINARTELALARQAAEQARQRLSDAVDALPVGFELYDADDRLVMVNAAATAMYPQLGDLADQRPLFADVVRINHARGGLPEIADEAALEAFIARRMRERRHPGPPHVMQVARGQWVRVHERRTRDGGTVGVRVDVTEAFTGRAAAEQATQRLQDAIDALPEAFALFDAEDRLVACNERYSQTFGCDEQFVRPGVTFEEVLRHGLQSGLYPQAEGRAEAWLAERMAAHRNPSGPVLQALAGNRWVRVDERRTRDGGVAGVRSDVTELVHREQALTALNAQLDALNARLAHLSDTDDLTGLANRRQFDRRLADECARARRHGTPIALLLLDVDHFKRYNDLHGHPAGDECLRQVAQVLRGTARRAGDLVARIGGEEFGLLLPHHSADEARAQAESAIAALAEAALPHGDSPVSPQVTLSIGGVQVAQPGAGLEAAMLVQRADEALYAAKHAGRQRLVMHTL